MILRGNTMYWTSLWLLICLSLPWFLEILFVSNLSLILNSYLYSQGKLDYLTRISVICHFFLVFNVNIWSRSRVWDWWFYAKHKLSQLLNYTFNFIQLDQTTNNQSEILITSLEEVRLLLLVTSRGRCECWCVRNVRINNTAAAMNHC